MKLHSLVYGSGSPLLILHGLMGSSDNWHTLAKRFGTFFHTFALDARNHGRSPHTPDFNYDVMAQDVMEFLHAQQLNAANIIGHSMGGKTAMKLALSHSQLVRRLIVVDIAPKRYPRLHDEILETLGSIELSLYTSRKDVDRALAEGIVDRTTRQFLMKNVSRDAEGRFMWKMNLPAIAQQYDRISEEIVSDRPYEGSTLFVASKKSGYVLDEDVPAIKRLFPRAEFVWLNTGHWIHVEAPEEFFGIVLDFLNRES
jgi:pimeloyl-ACP methyl ester carboxylesterase